MTLDEYNSFCTSLPGANHVVQWGGSHVWKVGSKLFAVAALGQEAAGDPLVTFKVSDMSFELLKDAAGCRPAPYLASRGMKWIQRISAHSMDDDALRQYIVESHRIVAARLTRAERARLGV
jgi:predicted DNA-binding protein (MmcQ/YjbR family)